MNFVEWSKSSLGYGHRLVSSALDGAHEGEGDFLKEESLAPYLSESAGHALGPAAVGAFLGVMGETIAKRYTAEGGFEEVTSGLLRVGDVIYVEANYYIAGDGEVIEGVASVDESAITGESAPVIREAGGDRSAVTGGAKGLSGRGKGRMTSHPRVPYRTGRG